MLSLILYLILFLIIIFLITEIRFYRHNKKFVGLMGILDFKNNTLNENIQFFLIMTFFLIISPLTLLIQFSFMETQNYNE